MRRILVLVVLLGLVIAPTLRSETAYSALSATATSQTYTISKPSAAVTICNGGTGVAYFRLFNEVDTTAAATTASSRLAVGACIEFSKPATDPAFFKAVSVVTNGTDTATIYVYSD